MFRNMYVHARTLCAQLNKNVLAPYVSNPQRGFGTDEIASCAHVVFVTSEMPLIGVTG